MDCADISLLSLRPAFAIINQALVQRIISANGQMGRISQCVVQGGDRVPALGVGYGT